MVGGIVSGGTTVKLARWCVSVLYAWSVDQNSIVCVAEPLGRTGTTMTVPMCSTPPSTW